MGVQKFRRACASPWLLGRYSLQGGTDMHRNSGLSAALFGFLAAGSIFGQPPKFVIADVHVSPTARTFAQNFGSVLREGRYVNRDATMLDLIVAAYGGSADEVAGGPRSSTKNLPGSSST